MPTIQGIIVGAFVADRWLEATPENFPGREAAPDRYGFVGKEADQAVQTMYVNKQVPEQFRKQGASNPIKYTWKQ